VLYLVAAAAVVAAFFVGLAFRCTLRQAQGRELDMMRMRTPPV
jgi:hypothetical protein